MNRQKNSSCESCKDLKIRAVCLQSMLKAKSCGCINNDNVGV